MVAVGLAGPGLPSSPHPVQVARRVTSAAARFALMFAVQFTAIGVMQPFLPLLFAARGAGPEAVGVLLAAGSLTRLIAGPMGGRLADALGDARLVMGIGAAVAAVASLGLLRADGFWSLLLVCMVMAVAMAPNIPLGDAMAGRASRVPPGFDYGRIRSAGSLSFIAAAALAGWVADRAGASAIALVLAACFALTAAVALILPRPVAAQRGGGGTGGFVAVFRYAPFRRLLPVSALIQGSHALYYGFGALHWQAAGYSPGVIGLLWAGAVLAEFFFFAWGGGLVERLGAPGLALLAALCGVLRWVVLALDPPLPLLFVVNCLHAASFGAMHLASIRVLAEHVPAHLAGTAQTLHSSLGVGVIMAALTLACGPLYAGLGGDGYWAMAALAALAVPAVWRLRKVLESAERQ